MQVEEEEFEDGTEYLDVRFDGASYFFAFEDSDTLRLDQASSKAEVDRDGPPESPTHIPEEVVTELESRGYTVSNEQL